MKKKFITFSRIVVSLSLSLIGLIGLTFLFSQLFDCMGTLLLKIGLALGGRALASTFLFWGLPGGLALAIACFARALITGEVGEMVGTRMMPAGSDSPGSGNWRDFLNSSPDSVAGGFESYPPEGQPAPNAAAEQPSDAGIGAQEGQPAAPPQPHPIEPYPYSENFIIGGDSVHRIQRRLLMKWDFPSSETIALCRLEAQDLFEVKARIILKMAQLDPTGDWMGRGARALENPRTGTGEESLDRLYQIADDLDDTGPQSDSYSRLTERVPRLP